MSDKDLTLHYATCTAISIAVWAYTGYIPAGIAAFIAASALLVRASETQKRP